MWLLRTTLCYLTCHLWKIFQRHVEEQSCTCVCTHCTCKTRHVKNLTDGDAALLEIHERKTVLKHESSDINVKYNVSMGHLEYYFSVLVFT